MTSIQSTAYHEAGHVVAKYRLGLHFYEVTICADEDANTLGHVRAPGTLGYSYSSRTEYKQVVTNLIIGAFAGLEAERNFDPDCDPELAEEDEHNAFNLLREIPPRRNGYIGDDAYIAKLDKLRQEARRLIRRHWGDVVIVADALLIQKTLTYDDVSKMLTSA